MFKRKKKSNDCFEDNYNDPWLTDIEGVTIGTIGSGFYDFAEFPIGSHKILIVCCNGYHISVDVPDWFDPSTDRWTSITVYKKWQVMETIQYLIDKINKNEGTNLTLKFKKNPNELTLEFLDKIPKIVFELSSLLGLNNISATSHKNYYTALKNSKKVDREDSSRSLWNKLNDLGFVEQYDLDTFRLTYRGLNFLQGCLLKPINIDKISLGRVSNDKAR